MYPNDNAYILETIVGIRVFSRTFTAVAIPHGFPHGSYSINVGQLQVSYVPYDISMVVHGIGGRSRIELFVFRLTRYRRNSKPTFIINYYFYGFISVYIFSETLGRFVCL